MFNTKYKSYAIFVNCLEFKYVKQNTQNTTDVTTHRLNSNRCVCIINVMSRLDSGHVASGVFTFRLPTPKLEYSESNSLQSLRANGKVKM